MSKEKKINEFTIDDLVKKIYNQIAEWHNDDTTSSGLKLLTFDIINEVSSSVFKHLDIPYNGEVKIDKEIKKEVLEKIGEKI